MITDPSRLLKAAEIDPAVEMVERLLNEIRQTLQQPVREKYRLITITDDLILIGQTTKVVGMCRPDEGRFLWNRHRIVDDDAIAIGRHLDWNSMLFLSKTEFNHQLIGTLADIVRRG